MSDYVQSLVERYRNFGIVVDTNLLLLYFVGSFDPVEISRFKRTQSFTQDDYVILNHFLKEFRKIVTTPNILTEVNSFSNQLAENIKLGGYFDVFARGITTLDEMYFPSVDLSRLPGFKEYGLTDVGILSLGRQGYLILTEDFKLSGYLANLGIDVLNFNHLRRYLL